MLFPYGVSRILSATTLIRNLDNEELNKTSKKEIPLFKEPILGIRKCSRLGLFFTFSADTITLWSIRPAIALSIVQRSQANLDEEGRFVDLTVSPNRNLIAVCTDRGSLHFYEIVYIDIDGKRLSVKSLQEQSSYSHKRNNSLGNNNNIFDSLHTRVFNAETDAFDGMALSTAFKLSINDDTQGVQDGPGEKAGALRCSLDFKLSLKISQGIRSLYCTDDYILLSTYNKEAILTLTWEGDIVQLGTFALSGLDFYLDENSSVFQITPCGFTNLFTWISESGRVYLVRRMYDSDRIEYQDYIDALKDVQEDKARMLELRMINNEAPLPISSNSSNTDLIAPTPKGWVGTCFYNADLSESRATCISFNNHLNLLAMGTESGEVYVYSLSDGGTELNFLHLCLPGIGTGAPIRDLNLGPVQSLAWSPDGLVLAVGWSEFGLSLWSAFGRMIAMSRSEDMLESKTPTIEFQSLEDYTRGVLDMFWSDGGYDLFILPLARGLSSSLTSGFEIHVVPFLKSSVGLNGNVDCAGNTFLLSDETLQLYRGNSHSVDILDVDVSLWDNVQLPLMYTSLNWPIHAASIDISGKYIALAGRRGFTYYNSTSGKWKLFGNEDHEIRFSINGGMYFIGNNLLICVCKDYRPTVRYVIRCFDCNSNLDLDSTVFSFTVDVPVLSITGFHTNIMTYCADNVVRHYSLYKEDNKHGDYRYGLLLVQEISLEGVVVDPKCVQYIGWSSFSLPKNLYYFVQRIFTKTNTRYKYHNAFSDSIAPEGIQIQNILKKTPIVILKNGELSILRRSVSSDTDINNPNWEMIALADKIEHCSVFRPTNSVPELQISLWGFDSNGAIVWTNINNGDEELNKALSPIDKESPTILRGSDQSLETIDTILDDERFGKEWTTPLRIPMEYVAVHILADRGIISGLEIVTSPNNALNALQFKTVDKTTLFISSMIEYFLSLDETKVDDARDRHDSVDNNEDELKDNSDGKRHDANMYRKSPGFRRAYKFAKSFYKLPYFNHALEILLHKALDKDLDAIASERKIRMKNRSKGLTSSLQISERILPKTTSFAKEFPDYLDILVQCARKIDVSAWPYLFSTVGNPLRLFAKCIHEGRLKTAVHYLIVLQSLESTFISGNCTAILLERACELRDFDTLQSLVRFLSGIRDKDGAIYAYVIHDYSKEVLGKNRLSLKDSAENNVKKDNSSLNWIPSNSSDSKYSLDAVGTMEFFFDRHPELVDNNKFNISEQELSAKININDSRKNIDKPTDSDVTTPTKSILTIQEALVEFTHCWKTLMIENSDPQSLILSFTRAMQ